MSKSSLDSESWEEPDPRRRHRWLFIALTMLCVQLLLSGIAMWYGWTLFGLCLGGVGVIGFLLFLRYGPYAKRR